MRGGTAVRFYFRLARPDQLAAVALVYGWGAVIAGVLLAAGRVAAWRDGLLPLLLVAASIHYANEYADHETDALTIPTPFSGGSGALAAYGAPPRCALRAAWASLAAGLLAAGLLVVAGRLPPAALILLALGAAGGWMYSLPPLALAWRGWGELDNAFLGGILLPAYGFVVQAGAVDPRIFLLTLPFGLHVFVNLLATTWADRRADRRVGKQTLATRWPVRRLRRLYLALICAAYGLLLLLRGWLIPLPAVWLTLFILPLALWAGRRFTRQHSPWPSVLVMLLFVLGQLAGWSAAGLATGP